MSDQTIKLDSEITIRNIQLVFAQLSELLTQVEVVHIDASQLSRVDTAGAQLLYLFSKTCDSRSLKVDWLHCQTDLVTNLGELGITLPHIQVDALEEDPK
ncbi:STAS domain-containing protein [Shewanella sp. VB17]|uniref:STAS domain-containing protein n=1 Tax=Shewanella sp. VB17 TaxID=2739432 RepID=UPI001565165D|nr:STAS domain-containing protein [Shewanella sp. VB17]NRD72271.1 STAS domain-containing protein [Shewanella sp. VB17]